MSTQEPPSGSSSSNDCQSLVDKRTECYRKMDLGHFHKDDETKPKYARCWMPILRAKRCLAFQHCAREAVEYYKSPSDKIVQGVNGPKDKGYCASYYESHCYGNPRIMKIDLDSSGGSQKLKKMRQDIFDHHEKWKRRVANSKPKQARCEDMRKRLHKCLHQHLG